MQTVVALTMGRGPRLDIVPDLVEGLKDRWRVVERGALQHVADGTLAGLMPTADDDALVAPLTAGREAIVSKLKLGAIIQREIQAIDADMSVDAVAILCTSIFPEFISRRPVIQVGKLMREEVERCGPLKKLGVLVPIDRQTQGNVDLFRGLAEEIFVRTGSPFGSRSRLLHAAAELHNEGVQRVVMSCMGFNRSIQEDVQKNIEIPCIAPGALLIEHMKSRLKDES